MNETSFGRRRNVADQRNVRMSSKIKMLFKIRTTHLKQTKIIFNAINFLKVIIKCMSVLSHFKNDSMYAV